MVKSEFIELLSEKNPQFNQREIESMTDFIIRTMINGLSNGKRIEIRGFGSLNIKYLKPRVAMNPQTRQTIQTAGRNKVHYRSSKKLRDAINPNLVESH